jgi:uncharacterized protein YbjT (DUF2867 family)
MDASFLDRKSRQFGRRDKVFRSAIAHLRIHQERPKENATMKIVVIGGTGLIGSKVASNLRQKGHEIVAAAPSTGVNTITGAGLAEALAGAQIVIDVANAPDFSDEAVLTFFKTSGRNLMGAGKTAGVRHHIALSVVGADRLPDSGYLRAKVAQEELIKASGIPYTIVRATQFFEFVGSIADGATDGQTVRLSPAYLQPVASDDVAALVANVATTAPANGVIELAGPERIGLDDLVRRYFAAKHDPRKVVTDIHARYFGTELNDKSLTPSGDKPHIGATSFETWLAQA